MKDFNCQSCANPIYPNKYGWTFHGEKDGETNPMCLPCYEKTVGPLYSCISCHKDTTKIGKYTYRICRGMIDDVYCEPCCDEYFKKLPIDPVTKRTQSIVMKAHLNEQ